MTESSFLYVSVSRNERKKIKKFKMTVNKLVKRKKEIEQGGDAQCFQDTAKGRISIIVGVTSLWQEK